MEDTNAGKRECSRCDRKLNKINTNPDGLCGYCQGDIASHHPDTSRPYIDWVMRGRPKEIRRTRNGTPLPANGPNIAQQTRALRLESVPTNDLLDELTRRRDEAEKIIAIYNNFGRK